MNRTRRVDLLAVARRAMLDRGFIIDVPPAAHAQLDAEHSPSFETMGVRDLSALMWSSIDNDDSRDLDQVECAQEEPQGIRVWVGIADVDSFVPRNSPLDGAARQNTTSIYTGVVTFPMLPEKLSTDLSSLNEGGKRLAMVTEMLVAADARILESSIYPAILENKAQLTYDAVAIWLDKLDTDDGSASHPEPPSDAGLRTLKKIEENADLQSQLRLQDRVARTLREQRHEAGALTFHTIELDPAMSGGTVVDLKIRRRNRASFIIEDLMIAANRITATFLEQHGQPSVRRIVREPKRWDRIVALAASLGFPLPALPDAKDLEAFLQQQLTRNPAHFADLSFAVIKLLGRGEYMVKTPGQDAPGHFGLAVDNYSHSTAPNRRYPDVLTQRLLKAAVAGQPSPYSTEELGGLARHCTEKENDANKVERLVKKCAAAQLLSNRIGQTFDAVVSGVTPAGTWVRLCNPPVEGRLDGKVKYLDVGHRVHVRLVSTNPERGFIDFELSGAI